MQIRKADHEDVNKVAELYEALHSYLEKNMNYPGWKRGIYPTREDAVKGITEGTLWVAVCDGRFVGTMILNHEPENGYEQAKWNSESDYRKILVIHTLAVHPQFMKSGIGNQLLEYAVEYAAQKNMKAVRLDVYEKNMPAIRLYESAGFRYVDTVDLGYSVYNLPLFRLYEKILEQPKIVKMDFSRLQDVNKPNEPFEIIGKLIPSFVDGKWGYTEEIYESPYIKEYPDDNYDYSEYIDNPDKILFLAYSGIKCIGQIILKKDWNKYAFIEDICVAKTYRKHGVGGMLIQKAIDWAKEQGLSGLALETQDNNLLACRFYAKCGFSIGAVNTMLYRNFDKPWSDENAVFWYMKF